MIKRQDILIWDREFDLPVDFDCYAGESVTDAQQKALDLFLGSPDWLAAAKRLVEEHCRQQVADDPDNEKKDNIFSYIKPEGIFVKHENAPRIAIMCKYRYDPEHGLAVVFSADGSVSVGSQDIIL